MIWVTRVRPKTDRIACPWLILKFIDPSAEIVYVAAEDVVGEALRRNGHSFDAPNAEFGHRSPQDGAGELCTFETLIEAYELAGDAALARLAKIVHAADITEDLGTDPVGAGLLAIGLGGLQVEDDDLVLLERQLFVYDALYAWCAGRLEVGAA